MADHLKEIDGAGKVDWKCEDVWIGNSEDINLKKFRKNQHQQKQAVDKKGLKKNKKTDHNKVIKMQFDNYTRGKGKCRLPNRKRNKDDSYYPSGPGDKRPIEQHRIVRNVEQCENVCSTDPKCTAFHFYLLDPGSFNNCWIWTAEDYRANGSDKAFCYIKKDM